MACTTYGSIGRYPDFDHGRELLFVWLVSGAVVPYFVWYDASVLQGGKTINWGERRGRAYGVEE